MKYVVKLKDNVSWEDLEKVGFKISVHAFLVVNDALTWYGFFEECDAHGFWSYVEINKASREVRNNNCLWKILELAEMGYLEKVSYEEFLTKTSYICAHKVFENESVEEE